MSTRPFVLHSTLLCNETHATFVTVDYMKQKGHISAFQNTVKAFYREYGRVLPWRPPSLTLQKDGVLDPYKILVSEIMLQQTQVDRVVPKYKTFIQQFPSFRALAQAPQKDVLKSWSGLGYNRRALNLHRTATIVSQDFGGRLPRERDDLLALPGIGPYTASAIRVFAYNMPDVMIETNIRSVFIYYIFIDKYIIDAGQEIHDKELLPLIEETLDENNPREWYYALIDYGAYLKKTVGNLNVQSKHYTKQSTFEGSNRQLRGNIIKALMEKPLTSARLATTLGVPDKKAAAMATELQYEGFIKKENQQFTIA